MLILKEIMRKFLTIFSALILLSGCSTAQQTSSVSYQQGSSASYQQVSSPKPQNVYEPQVTAKVESMRSSENVLKMTLVRLGLSI